MKVPLYNQSAQQIGEIDLNDKLFAVKSNLHLVTESVRVQQSNSRKGLSHTKTRGEVSGGGKKPWKQKGTGRARAGSTRSPIWRHGGITFGPRSNRNWELKLNKKAKSKALFMSLSDKAQHGKLVVIDQINLEPVKTKVFAGVMHAFHGAIKDMGSKTLVLLPKNDLSLMRASRNLPETKAIIANSLNILDVLKADTVVVLKESLPVIEKTYLK